MIRRILSLILPGEVVALLYGEVDFQAEFDPEDETGNTSTDRTVH